MMNLNTNNKVNFTARLDVTLSEGYMDKLKKHTYGEIQSSQLLQGMNVLKKAAGLIGTDKDVFRLFTDKNDNLRLSYNNKYEESIREHRVDLSIKEKCTAIVNDVIEEISERQCPHNYRKSHEQNINEIKSFDRQF